MNFTTLGNIHKDDFWELNPFHKLIDPFNKVKDQRLMWCVWMWCDPDPENKIYRLRDDIKLSAIRRYYPKFDPEEELTRECLLAYPSHFLTPAARAFVEEEAALIARAEMIKIVQRKLSEMAKENPLKLADKEVQTLLTRIDKMNVDSLQVYRRYDEVRKLFETEARNPRVYGGRKETIREKGELIIVKEDYE